MFNAKSNSQAGDALDLLRQNVALNKHLPNSSAVCVCECDWRDFAAPSAAASPPEACRADNTGQQERNLVHSHPQHDVRQQQQQEQQQAQQDPNCHLSNKAADLAFLKSTRWDVLVGRYEDGIAWLLEAIEQPLVHILLASFVWVQRACGTCW